MAATNLEVRRSDEAADDAQIVWVKTACRKDQSQTNLSNLIL